MRIDHLMFGAADLDAAVDAAEQTFGTRPVAGGAHPRLGTRNALLGLADGCYLEIIAPDSAVANAPAAGSFGAALAELPAPALITFAVASDDLPGVAAALERHGYGARGPVPTQRATPDGELLAWELLFPRSHPFGSLCPFFIDWGACRHPSADLPTVGRLAELVLGSPEADRLRELLADLAVPATVRAAAQPSLRAQLIRDPSPLVLASSAQSVALRFG